MLRASRTRSLVKAISWRLLATVTTMGLVYLFTRELTLSLSIGGLEIMSKLLIYYLHERAWNLTSWGLLPEKEEKTVLKQQGRLTKEFRAKLGR
jgi:uncharacterized membrane protein